jgi:D-alanyl-D-alanine dipeptidase
MEDSMAHDEAARVAFWIEYMERSYALAEAIIRHPLQESRERLASIPAAAKEAGVEMCFSSTRLAGQFERLFFIRESLIPDLMAIGRDMNARGWILKIEDGYRTRQMQTALGRTPAVFDRIVQSCIRECRGGQPGVELVFRRAMVLVANVPLTGTHMAGAAVDISVLRRDDGAEVWRGKPYLEMSEYTPMDSPFVSVEERQNRQEITRMMEAHGFLHYPGEFWHYNKGDSLYQIQAKSGQPGRYGPVDWDPASNAVTPYADPLGLLTPLDVLEPLIQQAMQRLGQRES